MLIEGRGIDCGDGVQLHAAALEACLRHSAGQLIEDVEGIGVAHQHGHALIRVKAAVLHFLRGAIPFRIGHVLRHQFRRVALIHGIAVQVKHGLVSF